MPLPIGFFMPLPLPIMIPFMMWQSAAIAAGFGTYFQFAKRRVSAMSNEEFNNTDPHELVNSMYNDIVQQIPSSFAKVDSLTPVMLQSMNVMLDQAVKWLQGAITGNFFGTGNTFDPGGEGGETTTALEDHTPIHESNTADWSISRLTTAIAKIRDHPHENHYDAVTTANIEKHFAAHKEKQVPTVGYHELDNNAATFSLALVNTSWPLIGKLRMDALRALTTANAILIMTNSWYGNAVRDQVNARSDTSKQHFEKLKSEILALISARNKWLQQGKSFSL